MSHKQDKPAFTKVPAWLICLAALAVIASWIPLALIARSRAVKSERPPIHMFLDMDFQHRFGPQDFQPHDLSVRFSDGRAMRPLVPGAVRNDTPSYGQEFDDDHSDIDYRMDRSLPFLYKALKP